MFEEARLLPQFRERSAVIFCQLILGIKPHKNIKSILKARSCHFTLVGLSFVFVQFFPVSPICSYAFAGLRFERWSLGDVLSTSL